MTVFVSLTKLRLFVSWIPWIRVGYFIHIHCQMIDIARNVFCKWYINYKYIYIYINPQWSWVYHAISRCFQWIMDVEISIPHHAADLSLQWRLAPRAFACSSSSKTTMPPPPESQRDVADVRHVYKMIWVYKDVYIYIYIMIIFL